MAPFFRMMSFWGVDDFTCSMLVSNVVILASIEQVITYHTPCYFNSFYSGVYEHIRNHQSISNTVPLFDVTNERNVSSFVAQVIYLYCAVQNIGDRTVSI